MKGRSRLHESEEDYLETIYILKNRNGSVRSVDVAAELGFSRPSVSRAVGLLKQDGLLSVGKDGELTLTPEGSAKASEIYEKHTVLTRFLMLTAGIDPDTAENDACRIEHIISPDTFDGIRKYMSCHEDRN